MSAPPGLNPQQQQSAQFIFDRAVSRGIPKERAVELAAAAYSESGLDAKNYNGRSAGKPYQEGKTAAGYFQLLSKGYIDKANAGGGVFDPAANTDAILPAYADYWSKHPNAAPGEAARDVELSGEGAGFYTKGMSLLGFLGGKGGAGAGPAVSALGGVNAGPAPAGPDPRRQFAMAIAAGIGQKKDPYRLLEALTQLRQGLATQTPAPAYGGAAAPGYAPSGAADLVTIAKGANRPGMALQQPVVDFVGQIASIYGQPLEIGTGTNHNQYVAGTNRESDHWTGWGADIPAAGDALTRLGRAALVAAGADPAWAAKQAGGLFNIGGRQIIFNSNEGGNHFNHLHVGIRGR